MAYTYPSTYLTIYAIIGCGQYAANGMPPSHRAHGVPPIHRAHGMQARVCRSIATLWYLMPGHPWHLANDMPAIHYMGYGPDPTVSLDQHSSPTPDSGTACWSDGLPATHYMAEGSSMPAM
jgi:hypothetical protein